LGFTRFIICVGGICGMEKPLIILVTALTLIAIVGCSLTTPSPSTGIPENTTNSTEKLYPTVQGIEVKYCEGLGYNYEYRQDESGKYVGYCQLAPGVECTADDFFSGLCHTEFSLCEIKGYTLKIAVEQQENLKITYPICIFPDGSYCKESDFFYRKCPVSW